MYAVDFHQKLDMRVSSIPTKGYVICDGELLLALRCLPKPLKGTVFANRPGEKRTKIVKVHRTEIGTVCCENLMQQYKRTFKHPTAPSVRGCHETAGCG